MAFSLKIYTDAALTAELTGNLVSRQNVDGSTPPVETQLWLGSTVATSTFQASSDPGVDNISLSVLDADPGNGHETTEVKLATAQGGLAGAVAGDPLDLGLQISGGVVNAVPFWIQVDDATATLGTSTELSVQTNNIDET